MVPVIILFILLILQKLYYKDWANPAVLMTLLWTAIMFVYNLGLLPLNEISNITTHVIVIGVLLFNIGVFFTYQYKILLGGKELLLSYNEDCYVLNYRLIIALGLLSILLFLPDAINSINLLLNGFRFTYIRTNNTTSVITNSFLLLIRNYIAMPYVIVIYPLSAWCLLSSGDKKYVKTILTIAITLAILQIFSGGGRASIVFFIVHFIVMATLLKKRVSIPRYSKILIAVLLVFVLVVYYYVSLSRGIENMSDSMLLYFVGCVPLLDTRIEMFKVSGTYSFGGVFIYGFLNLVFTLLGNIGIAEPAFMDSLRKAVFVEETLQIGTGYTMNAFVTCWYYFFIDGGFFALIIESFLYGAISCGVYKNAIRYSLDVRKIICYAIITNTILFSFIRFQFIQYHYLLSLLMIPFLIKREGIFRE